jgi:23S rRNA pseudouridine1911/1915/1917 synthase
MGFPLVGDELYARGRNVSEKIAPEIRVAIKSLNRQALHAFQLGFEHPVSGKWLEFESDLPEEIDSLVKLLEKLDRCSD